MAKPKYEKPVSRDLSSISTAQGSCVSGNPEVEMVNCTTTGEIALGTCNPGSVVYPPDFCDTGSEAGYSCVNGWGAG